MSTPSPFVNPQIVPTAIIVPNDTYTNNNGWPGFNSNLYNLPGTGIQGSDLLSHLQLNIKAKLNLPWCSKTILNLSSGSNTYFLKQTWLIDHLLDELQNNFDKTAALSLRNLAQDPDFTQALALNSRTKKVLSEVLSHYGQHVDEDFVSEDAKRLENVDNELLSYTIDIVESVSSYYAPCPKDDKLFVVLTELFLDRNDRSLLISIMRSFARFLVRSELSVENAANNLSSPIFDKIVSFLLVDDYDLILTSLDFLYQYSLPGNNRISTLLKSTTRQEILKTKLPQLLTFQLKIDSNPNDFKNVKPLRLVKRTRPPIPTSAPKLSPAHYKEISHLTEPMRATAWMRCSYRANPEGEVTQISLWKSYEQQFETDAQQNKKKLLPAVDFIKNVSQAFQNSSAMVINLSNGQRKFIIKGIEPRYFSVDIKTGDSEAFNQVPNKVEVNLDFVGSDATQVPLEKYTPPQELNEVNKSSSLLITSLTNNPIGKELFKPIEEDIFKHIEAAPILFNELVDALKYLQD